MEIFSEVYTKSIAVVLTFLLCLLNNYILCTEFSPASQTTSSFYTYWEAEKKSHNRNTEKKNLQVHRFGTISSWPFMKEGLNTELFGCECKLIVITEYSW